MFKSFITNFLSNYANIILIKCFLYLLIITTLIRITKPTLPKLPIIGKYFEAEIAITIQDTIFKVAQILLRLTMIILLGQIIVATYYAYAEWVHNLNEYIAMNK